MTESLDRYVDGIGESQIGQRLCEVGFDGRGLVSSELASKVDAELK